MQATASETVSPTAGAFVGDDHAMLLASMQELSYLRDLPGVMAVVRRWARQLTGADGVTFVLREKDQCFYADEEAVGPLWKGLRFPMSACISGWAMTHREVVAIEDIYADPRVPHDAYRPTFVKSLLLVPIRAEDPIGAIGCYWATHHRAAAREIGLVQALANATSIAVANAELYRAEQDAVRARDEFLSVAAHELRTPLTSLSLQLQGAARAIERHATGNGNGNGDDAAIATRIKAARKASQRVVDLVDHMLDASRLTVGGALPLQPEPLDLVEIVREVVERFREANMLGGSTVAVAAPQPVPGRWDRARLDEAVTNMVSNACKYGLGAPVEIAVELRDGRAILAVRDHGIGVGLPDQGRIFEAFDRAVSRDSYGGLGLGLFLTRRIVEAHGGTIRVESDAGRGATFTAELPLGQVVQSG